ncbi:MAG: hypothetical protein R2737_03640 [Candidatus Nanopelagicales bacterium]
MSDSAFGYAWNDVLLIAAVLVVLGLLLTAVYRTMDHPRLPVVREAGKLPRVTLLGLVFYLLSIGPLVLFWYLALLITLLVATTRPTADEIAVMSVAVIVATRALAHISRPTAHEVGKVIPIAVLSVFILGSVVVDETTWDPTLEQLDANAGQLGTYMLIALVAELVITAAWYLALVLRASVAVGWRRWREAEHGHRGLRRARAELEQIARTGQTLAVAEASNQETGRSGGGPVGERSRAEVAAAVPTAAAVGDTVVGDTVAGDTVAGDTARQRQALDVDLVPEQTSDDTDASWGDGSGRSGGGGDGDDLRRFLDERPPHHGS